MENATAVTSGNAALHITFLAHNIEKEDEVITNPSIFIVTVNSILYTEKSEGKGTWT